MSLFCLDKTNQRMPFICKHVSPLCKHVSHLALMRQTPPKIRNNTNCWPKIRNHGVKSSSLRNGHCSQSQSLEISSYFPIYLFFRTKGCKRLVNLCRWYTFFHLPFGSSFFLSKSKIGLNKEMLPHRAEINQIRHSEEKKYTCPTRLHWDRKSGLLMINREINVKLEY